MASYYWLTQPITQLLTFLKQMKTIITVSITQQVANMGANFCAINSYFSPLVPAHLFDIILGTPYIPPEPDIPIEPG
jgi:hypothetical protein